MFVTGGIYTKKVAAEVGAVLKYLFEHPEDENFFELILAHDPSDETKDEIVHIRLVDDINARVVPLANRREIVRCITSSGRHLDIMFGHEAEREIEPAMVFLEAEQ